jgi:hypothetical protein
MGLASTLPIHCDDHRRAFLAAALPGDPTMA